LGCAPQNWFLFCQYTAGEASFSGPKVGASNDGYFAELVLYAAKATTCTVPEVEKQIKQLTEEYATGGDQFISSQVSVLHSQDPPGLCWLLDCAIFIEHI